MKSKNGTMSWKIGEWAKVEGKLELCSNGLHAYKSAYKSMTNVFGNRWFIAETRKKTIKDGKGKICASEMRLVREIPDMVFKRFALFCAKDSLKNYAKFAKDDNRVSECIRLTEEYLDGKCTLAELQAAESAAALSARSAGSAWSAGSARSAGSAWSARSAGSARSAWSAWSAWSAGSAGSARSARSAGSAWSARWTALDDDFYYFIFEHEYCLNPDKEYPVNENDKKYLQYSELLLEALEAGCGYRVEWEDTLYLVPTPLVKIDELNRFHSTKEPAIKWKGGKEFYFLRGVSFDKKWWKKVVNDKFKPEEIFAIDNLEHRRIAYEFMDKTKMKSLKDYKILDEAVDAYENPMKVISFSVKGVDEPLKYVNVFCPSTGREYFIGTNEDKCTEAKAKSFGFGAEEMRFIGEW